MANAFWEQLCFLLLKISQVMIVHAGNWDHGREEFVPLVNNSFDLEESVLPSPEIPKLLPTLRWLYHNALCQCSRR